MNRDENHEAVSSHAVVRWEALPRPKVGGRLSRRDVMAMDIIGLFLGAKTIQVDALGEEYVRGEAVGETHAANKLARDAVDAAMGMEREASHAASLPRQSEQWMAALTEIERASSKPAKFMAIAKLFEQHPALSQQLERVLGVIQLLRSLHGAQVEIETVDRRLPEVDFDRPYFTPLFIDLD